MRAFRELNERQIARARAPLSWLMGEGKPRPERRPETAQEAATSARFRMMSEAGVLPHEFELKKRLDASRAELDACYEEGLRRAATARIAKLEMPVDIAVEAGCKFLA